MFAACRLVQIVSASNQSLGDMVDQLPKAVSTPEIRIFSDDEKKFGIVLAIKKDLGNKFPLVDIDGIRLDFGDGWALIRASNTQPALTLRFGANDSYRLMEFQEIVQESLLRADLNLNFL